MNANLNPLLDGTELTPEIETPATVNMRPTVDLPSKFRVMKPSYWCTEGRTPQYGGWSPELGCYARAYGEFATSLYEAYGASMVQGEKTGEKVALVFETYVNSNGLLFLARSEDERDYISINEHSVETVDCWTPKAIFKNAKNA